MFKISKLVWLLVILECIQQLHCSAIDEDEIKSERCLNKFNVTQTTRGNTTGLSNTLKNKCVDDCIDSDDHKSEKLKTVGMTKLLCSSSLLKNIPDDNQQMEVCFSKFNMTPTTRIDTHDSIAKLEIQCLARCISPNIAENDEWKRLVVMFCSSFENTRENNAKLPMCFTKYNATKQYSKIHDGHIEGVKNLCAVACVSPTYLQILAIKLRKIGLETNGTKLSKECESFESTPENNQKLDTCFTNYNASKSLNGKYLRIDRFDEEMKVACAFKCVSPLIVEPGYFFGINRDVFKTRKELDQICPSIEITPENSARKQGCFDKYSAPKSVPDESDESDDVARLKFKCAKLCYSPELAKAALEWDEMSTSLMESICQTFETPTQNRRQVDDHNSKMGNSL